MSYVANQQRTLLHLLAALRPHWHRDANLPARIQTLLAGDRRFGSRDRRLYRELIYTTLRYLPWIEPLLDAEPEQASQNIAWLAADIPATHAFRAELTVSLPPCPASVAAKAAALSEVAVDLRATALDPATQQPPPGGRRPPLTPPLPEWFRAHCPAAFEPAQTDALLARAPLWLRLQAGNPARVFDEFKTKGWAWRESSVLPSAVELQTETDATKSDAYERGLIEVQDLGSQMILASLGLSPGGHWLDACAGAGGKTLQLATLLGASGQIDAHDIRPAALAELADRARRAGFEVVADPARSLPRGNDRLGGQSDSATPLKPGGHRPPLHPISAASIRITVQPKTETLYDGVLVDAPCSGSGTWRRAPHLKWTTTPEQIAAAAQQQKTLLDRFSAQVRPGGQLVYATCSLSHVENEEVVAAFLATHPDFSVEPLVNHFGLTPGPHGLTMLPARHNTDGFFVSALRRSERPTAV
jgi:16S rRNA (cytosine967-C5)-methyltransferase